MFEEYPKRKDIRLLGDFVKIELHRIGVEPVPYILLENLFVLFISGKVVFDLPFGAGMHTLLPLAVVGIGVIYGVRASLLGLVVYVFLRQMDLPDWLLPEAPYLLEKGFVWGVLPAAFVGAFFANLEWDKSFGKGFVMLMLGQMTLTLIGVSTHKGELWPQTDWLTLLSALLPSWLLLALLGASALKIIWIVVDRILANHEKP